MKYLVRCKKCQEILFRIEGEVVRGDKVILGGEQEKVSAYREGLEEGFDRSLVKFNDFLDIFEDFQKE